MRYRKAVDAELEGATFQGYLTASKEEITAVFGEPIIRIGRTWMAGFFFQWPIEFIDDGDTGVVVDGFRPRPPSHYGALYGDGGEPGDLWRVSGHTMVPLLLINQVLHRKRFEIS